MSKVKSELAVLMLMLVMYALGVGIGVHIKSAPQTPLYEQSVRYIEYVNPHADGKRIARTIFKAAFKYGLPPQLLVKQARVESGFDVSAQGAAGERGLFQITPKYWSAFCDEPDLLNPVQNTDCAARIMAKLLNASRWNYATALEKYNAGRPGTAAGKRYADKVLEQ